MKKNNKLLIHFLSGVTGGICLSLILGAGLFSVYLLSINQQIEREASTPLPVSEQSRLLDEAELALNSGDPKRVRALLYPAIERWTSTDEIVRGYRLLGEAELMQGHAQLSVSYFDKLYVYEPSAENLFLLATAYDMGGDNKNALEKYQELANWEDLPDEIDIVFVKMRIEGLSRTLGTPAPTP